RSKTKIETKEERPMRTPIALALVPLLLLAQQPMTNDDVVRIVKAGMSDEVVVGMIQANPGNYSITPDAVIALKTAGVSDKVVSAILGRNIPARANESAADAFVLHDGTPIKLRLGRTLSSADAKVGESVDFEILEDIVVGGVVVIARSGTAIATVTEAQPKKRMARGGKLNVN